MIVENGKCAVCGKPLEKGRLFICIECQEKEFRKNVIECMRRAHFMDYSFIHGEEYIKKHRAWIDWEFERKLKRMTNVDWEKVINGYIEAVKGGDKVICDKCKYLIDSVDEVGTPMCSFPVHTRRCKKHETCGGEWCDKYEMKEGDNNGG